jgi:hypothetical protein
MQRRIDASVKNLNDAESLQQELKIPAVTSAIDRYALKKFNSLSSITWSETAALT